ncbi:MAG: hypothetical protein ACJ8GN_02860 [Longimicrobiaceae bacterium]
MRPLLLSCALAILAAPAGAQQDLPVIRSNVRAITIRDGAELKVNGWALSPEAKPDVYEALLPLGVPHRVTFITDVDSIGFRVEPGAAYDFNVRYRDTLAWTRIVGVRLMPAAVFDSAFRAANAGKTRVEVPEVYELVSVALALTPTARGNPGLVHTGSPYHAEVQRWFGRHAAHPAIALLDSALRQNPRAWPSLKMNAYAFAFDARGRIVPGGVYDRLGPAAERTNTLLPFLEPLQRFAGASGFRRFYREHRATYQAQTAFFRDTAGVEEARAWLARSFAPREPFQLLTLVVSPLTGDSVSVATPRGDGFAELQPHYGFPYAEKFREPELRGLPEETVALYRRNAAIARIHRAYLLGEASKYPERILWGVSNRGRWVDPACGADYYPGTSAFSEYLAWALVAIRLSETAPEPERARAAESVERLMAARGFPRYPAFSRFVVPLYAGRRAGQTVADLFPAIVAWFEDNNGW